MVVATKKSPRSLGLVSSRDIAVHKLEQTAYQYLPAQLRELIVAAMCVPRAKRGYLARAMNGMWPTRTHTIGSVVMRCVKDIEKQTRGRHAKNVRDAENAQRYLRGLRGDA